MVCHWLIFASQEKAGEGEVREKPIERNFVVGNDIHVGGLSFK